MNFTHHWVNHSQNFVHPIFPDIHINSIEGFWSRMRRSLRRNVPIQCLEDSLNYFLYKNLVPKNEQYLLLLHTLSQVK